MSSYRLFFLSEEGRVDGGEAFEAASDGEAASICSAIVAACSDIPGGFMLWRGARQLLRVDGRKSQPLFATSDLDVETQRRLLDLEKSILQSRWRVSESRTLLQSIKSLCDRLEPSRRAFDEWTIFARQATHAEKATLQLLENGELRLVASSGFDRPFLDFFGVVRRDEKCACGKVFEQREPIVVPDVRESPVFVGHESLTVLENAGVRSVISTPILAKGGRMVGVVSTHKSRIWSRAENDLERLRLLADQVAAMVAEGPAAATVTRWVGDEPHASAVACEAQGAL